MEMVRITKRESELIESFKEDFNMNFSGMSFNKFVSALKDGYEVEPEFKVGDWVTDIHPEDNVTGVITKIDTDPYGNKIAWGYYSYDDIETNLGFEEIRPATPSEIAQEKERRWWKKHGRDVNEYKSADVIRIENGIGLYEVVDNYDNKRLTVTSDFANTEFAIYVDEAKLVAPVENRLDVKTDD